MSQKLPTVIRIALLAVSTPLVCAVTVVFSIYVPQTRGFFNIGETMVYAVALLFGPLIGAFAGGVGSSLADLLLGYPYYAPATLVIKACEGGVVGFLGRRKPGLNSKPAWRAFTFCVGLLVGITLGVIGSLYYSGQTELSLGIPQILTFNLSFSVPPEFWYLIGAIAIVSITLAGFLLEPELGWLVFAQLIGGSIMIAGYYVYQKFILFPLFGIADVVAEAEIPFNIGQAIVGLVIATPIVKIVRQGFPRLKS